MLRFGLVLLLATSALAAPGFSSSNYDNVNLNLYYTNEVGIAKNSGRTNHLTDGLSSLVDGGDTNIYIVTTQQILNDLASSGERSSQALALGQAVSITLGLATGSPGDVCKAAALIDGYSAGNYRGALNAFINHISNNLDLLIKLVKNPQAARFASGPRGSCSRGGRVYDFEGAWSKIISNATPANNALLTEQYCSAKRLYNAFNARSNNIGALITASAIPPFQAVIEQALGPLSNFVNAVVSNGNVSGTLGAAKQALAQAAQRV